MKYIRLEWADSQEYMEDKWIKKGCILGNDNDVFVPEELLEEENEEVKVLNEIEEKRKKGLPLTDVEQEIISSRAFK